MKHSWQSELHKAIRFFSYTAWAAIIFAVLMIVTDVSGRFLFDSPLPASVEMTNLIMPYMIFPGLAYALARGSHVRVTLLTQRLPARAKLGTDIFTNLIGFVFLAMMVYATWMNFWTSFVVREYMDAPIILPWYVGKFIAPIGIAFFSIQYLILLVADLKKIVKR